MDLFQRAKAVRLRSHNDKYLLAEDDEERVCQNRNGTTRQARWQVELVDEAQADQPIIRLKSCYGKYLSASNEPFLFGVTGRKVLQVSPARRLDSSLEWEPIRDGFQVKLKTRYGHFLRANGGPPPWRNTVTHDIPHLHHDWVLWEVDIVEARAYSPLAPPAEPEISLGLESVDSSASFSKQESFSSSASNSPQKTLSSVSSGSPRRFHSRTINYMVANNDGYVEAGAEEFTFNFQGTSVEQLTQKLEEETELGHIIVCSKNPVNGKLYPLRLQLPPNKNTMSVVVLLASSKAAKSFAQ